MKRDIWDSATDILQKRAIFEENRAFLLKPTIPDRFQTQNVRETQYLRFRCVWSVKLVKNADLCTETHVK